MALGGGQFISTAKTHFDQPRVLLLVPDAEIVARLHAAFESPRPTPPQEHASNGDQRNELTVASLHELSQVDLTQYDAAICSAAMRDGCGLDAVAALQSLRSDLPVILIGTDSSIAAAAIRHGAADYFKFTTASDLDLLPLAVEKCLVHQRVTQENKSLHCDLRRSLAELAVTNEQLQAVIHQLEALARTDDLTGLSNRRWFNLMLHGNWAEATRANLPLACLMIDLDGFKAVNDNLGHHHGDEMLRLAAKVIRANCREVDVPARYGGDEFCVLMPHTRAAEAVVVGLRLLRQFEIATKGLPMQEFGDSRVSMSIGVSQIDLSRPVNAEQLVSHADEAMYAAKNAGKRRVMVRLREAIIVASESADVAAVSDALSVADAGN